MHPLSTEGNKSLVQLWYLLRPAHSLAGIELGEAVSM